MGSDPSTIPETSSGFLDPVEAILAAGIDEACGDWDATERLLCARHPEHAEAIRWRIGYVRDHRGIQPEAEVAAQADGFPERLGDFRLLRRLGGGGMGVVYLATQESLSREVALKLIRPEHLYFEGSKARFRREVEAIARLHHEGIVPVHLVGEQDGVPFLAMEHVTGCTLAEVLEELPGRDPATLTGTDLRGAVLRRLGRDDDATDAPDSLFQGSWVEVCFRIARQIAEALAHAHDQGILHRDVKPSNVMVTPRGRAMLLDFGLAHVEGEHRLTLTGSTIGSLPYLSPEQVADTKGEPDPRMDVYALGVTLYELLTLRAPYLMPSGEGTRQLILRGQPEPPSRHNRAVPWDAETICLTAMEKDPQRRYPTAAAMAADLGNVLALRPIAARRPGPALRLRRWVRRHRAWSAAMTVGLVLLVAGASLLIVRDQEAALQIGIRQDALLVQALLTQAEDAWPANPGEVPRTDEWLTQADSLHRRIQSYQPLLRAIEDRADPLTDAELERDRELRAAAERQLADVRAQFLAFQSRAAMRVHQARVTYEALLEDLEIELRVAGRKLRERYTWRFADPEETAVHQTLVGLAADLVPLGDALRAFRQQRQRVLDEPRVTLRERAAAWQAAIRAIADRSAYPLYDGLQIAPQCGLVPIGPDPDSGLFEFAHVMTGEAPVRRPETGELTLAPGTGMVFVLIPGGDLLTSVPNGPRTVRVDPFLISKYEMTQGQWQRVAGRNPSHVRAGWTIDGREITERHPVEYVSWVDCDRLLPRLGLCLPTRVQWEYAARGGEPGNWWVRRDWRSLEGAGNIADLSLIEADAAFATRYGGRNGLLWDDGFVLHAPVGVFRPNGFGLHDVVGNVSEWCRDLGAERAGAVYRIQCGSGFEAPVASSATWYIGTRDRARSVALGVRPARELER